MTDCVFWLLKAPLAPGSEHQLGARTLRVVGTKPYTRKTDGETVDSIVWCASCATCGSDFEFMTGATAGTMRSRCNACHIKWCEEKGEARRHAVEREAEVRKPASPVDVYRAVQATQGSKPKQMSVARNAPRRIYAPLLLRDHYPPLAGHTVAEILLGLEEAMRLNMVGWDNVGRYKSGNPRKGLWARPNEAKLREIGWWPKDDAAAAAGALD